MEPTTEEVGDWLALLKEHPFEILVVILVAAIVILWRAWAAERKSGREALVALYRMRDAGAEMDPDTTRVMTRGERRKVKR